MKNVIVTGGCGYIGSHVARAFKQLEGANVTIIDQVKRDHTLKDIDGYLIDDFASDASLSMIVNTKPDVVVHCAGTSLVGPSMTNPAEYYNNNIAKTIRMMDVIKSMDEKPAILFSSSASIYGEPRPEQLPLSEHEPRNPISPYGSTKATTEWMLRDYGSAYGIDTVCFRYFNAAGAMPGTYDLGQELGATHIVARVLEASIFGKDFTLNGDDFDTEDGSCVRDYVHVWDIALAHVLAVHYLDRLSSQDRTAVQDIFNLGTNKGISNKQIINYVQHKYGLTHLEFGPRRWGDPAKLVADANDASVWLGWTPVNSSLESIVDSAYKWYTRK